MRGLRRTLPDKRTVITIYCRVHKTINGSVLAVCDKELAGKTLRDGEIEFFVSEKFYRGTEISEKQLRKKLKSFDNINLVGSKAVKIAVEEKLVGEKSILFIQKKPHVQIFVV